MWVMSNATARLIGKALGMWAWENGATDRRGELCDCVGVEETNVYEALCRELVEIEGEDGPLYATMFDTMYAHARELAREHGDRDRGDGATKFPGMRRNNEGQV